MDSARALIARGWGVSLVSRCLRVSRAQLHVILRRTDDWKDGRRSRHSDDTDVLLRIHHVIGELPTYGYRRVTNPSPPIPSVLSVTQQILPLTIDSPGVKAGLSSSINTGSLAQKKM